MSKKIIILIISLLLSSGCMNKINQNDDIKRYYLDNLYYNRGNFINIENLDNINSNNYILYIYNSSCSMKVPCEDIFKKFMDKYNIDFLSMHFDDFKKTNLYNKVKYAPSILIIIDNKIVSYLDSNSDEDLKRYQDEIEFEKWMNKYIFFEKEK